MSTRPIVPELATRMSKPDSRAVCAAMAAAIGLRQMLPLQTNSSIGAARGRGSEVDISSPAFDPKGRESVAKNGALDETSAQLPQFCTCFGRQAPHAARVDRPVRRRA